MNVKQLFDLSGQVARRHRWRDAPGPRDGRGARRAGRRRLSRQPAWRPVRGRGRRAARRRHRRLGHRLRRHRGGPGRRPDGARPRAPRPAGRARGERGGALTRSYIPDASIEEFRRTLELNVTGTYICAQSAARAMIPRRRGKIVTLGSIHASLTADKRMYDPDAFFRSGPPYHAAKGAVLNLTRSLAAELAEHNIQVNCLSPGHIPKADVDPGHVERHARMTPLGRLGAADDLKGAVALLASRASDWITGHNLVVDGGLEHLVSAPAGSPAAAQATGRRRPGGVRHAPGVAGGDAGEPEARLSERAGAGPAPDGQPERRRGLRAGFCAAAFWGARGAPSREALRAPSREKWRCCASAVMNACAAPEMSWASRTPTTPSAAGGPAAPSPAPLRCRRPAAPPGSRPGADRRLRRWPPESCCACRPRRRRRPRLRPSGGPPRWPRHRERRRRRRSPRRR